MCPAGGHEVDGLHGTQRNHPFVGARITDHADRFHRKEHREGLTGLVVQIGLAQFVDEDRVGACQQLGVFALHFAQDAHAEAGPRERMAVDHRARQAELDADPAYFVLEQFAQRLDQLQLHVRRQTADVVMALDDVSLAGFAAGRFDHVRIDRALRQPLHPAPGGNQLFRFLVENFHEQAADDLALGFRIGHAFEGLEIAIGGIDADHLDAHVLGHGGHHPHGQGEETTFAQVIADELGIPLDDVQVIHGDTATTPMGWGTYGSRTTAVGGAACALAARKIVDKARKVAAHLLEASEVDVVFENGRFFVQGSPERAKTFQEVTLQAYLAWNLPPGLEPGLEASAFYDPPNFTYPFGTHLCAVEVDANTGKVTVLRYVAVDDCGKAINPLIVDGQVHGGITQGLAQALYETALYDESGQLLTGSMTDYAVPKASQLPIFETARTETPSPHNPLGVKGVGETGTIAATAAVVNAVLDALHPLGIRHLDMPLTPARIWRAVQEARAKGAPDHD